MSAAEERDVLAETLAALALELAVRVRDEDPAEVDRWLRASVPCGEWPALAVVLAAHIPLDRPARELLRWWTGRSTLDAADDRAAHAEYVRLRSQGLAPDQVPPAVLAGERRWQRDRSRRTRAAAKAAAVAGSEVAAC